MVKKAQSVIHKHMSEKELEKMFLQAIELIGYTLNYHAHFSLYDNPGFLDHTLIRLEQRNQYGAILKRARLAIVELKTEKGIVSPEQHLWIVGWKACGVDVFVVRPSNLMETIEELKR